MQNENQENKINQEFVEHFVASIHGIDLAPIFSEVCRSNESKFDWQRPDLITAPKGWSVHPIEGTEKTCVKNEYGKLMKPPTYSPADVKGELVKQWWEAK